MKTLEQVKERVQLANCAVNNRVASIEEQDEYDDAVIEAIDLLLHIDGMSHERANKIVNDWVAETEGGWPFVG